jgi:Bacterial Ig-like domain (group 1)
MDEHLAFKLRTPLVLATLAVLLTVACAYHLPDAPSVTPPISPTVPFSLTLGATSGMGADAGRGIVTAKVQNVNGAPLPGVTVQFATNVGTLSEASVDTGTDGIARTTITATDTAEITATAGTLTAHTLVASQPPPPR